MKKITSLVLCLCGLFLLSGIALAKANLPFIANNGQVHESVRFYAPTFSGTVFVTAGGDIIYSFPKADKRTAITETFIGATVRAITGQGESITKVSDFRGKDPAKWRSYISAYDSLDLGEIWQGVNLNLKAYSNNVEKLFSLSPGTAPQALKIRLKGANSLHVNKAGELEAETRLGIVTFTKPVAYQEMPLTPNATELRKKSPLEGGKGGVCSDRQLDYRRETPPCAPLKKGVVKKYVDISYIVNNDEYTFKLGDYDRKHPLFIDPMLAATFLGGTDEEYASIALDKNGNVYAVGETYSPDFPVTSGSYDESRNKGSDVFISKFTGDLTTLLLSAFLGGTGDDAASSVILDSSGNVYVTGETSSSDFPTTPGVYDTTPSIPTNDKDAFVAKFDADLATLSASTYIGGKGKETCTSLISDGNGNIYIAGDTTSSDFSVTSGSFDETYNSGNTSGGDIFISKFDANLTTLSASTFLGQGGASVVGATLLSDGKGNLYVTGQTRSPAFPTTPGAYNETFTGDNDNVFISKISGNLKTLLASTFLGGNAEGSFIASDKNGNIYVSGGTFSAAFPTTSGAYNETFSGGDDTGGDAFVSKLDANLTTLLASTFLGGSVAEFVNGIASDQKGKIYVSGITSSPDFPTTPAAYDRSFNGGSGDLLLSGDVFVSVFDSDLKTLSASTFLGGIADDWSNSVVLTENGNIYVSGFSYSYYFPMGSAGYDKTFGGKSDAFVVKLDGYLSALPSLFNFETATSEGWQASTQKGELGVSGVNVSSEQSYSGEYSLAMSVHLNAADADLNGGAASVMVPGNMTGRQITAWLKLSKGASGDPAHPNGVQLFVKDQDFRIQMSAWQNIGADIPEDQWTQIKFTPATTNPTGGYTDAGFDPSQVIVVGVKLSAGTGSQTPFQGLCYLDVVTVDTAPLNVPESDYVFDFNTLTTEQQRQQPFGYGSYWNTDPNWGTAFKSENITIHDGSLAVNANFTTGTSDTAQKGYIGVELQPNADISNKKNRILRAEIKFDSYIGPGQMLATLFLYDRQPGCQGETCLWYRSKDFRVGGHGWNEITFDLDAENISDDSLKNMLKVGIQFYSDSSYSGKIFIDNVTIGGKENIADFSNLNQGFVSRKGANFELNGKPYRFAGSNVYYLFYKSHFMIDDVMKTMQRNGIEVLRTWAFGQGIPQNTDEATSFQPEKGLYYEPVFANLDYVIKSAGEHGIRLILPLANYWSEFGGMAQYLEWCGLAKENIQAFYTDSNVKSAYKDYVKTVLNRVNTLTGIAYKDDPTIFAWELVNEPRCETCQNGEIAAWISEMSQFVRRLDTKHLVGIGDEGFLRENGNTDNFYNGYYGVDWEQNLGIENIDFGTVHVYPELWNKDSEWASEWILTHIRRAEQIGKPVIFEEFGIKAANRDKLYTQWTTQFENDLRGGTDGDLVWMIAGKVNGSDDEHETIDGSYYYPDSDGFAIHEPDSTMAIIRQHAENMRKLSCSIGDINKDGAVNLKDAVLALQICGNITGVSEDICKNADVNGDGSIGTQEAVYALKTSSES